MLPMSRLSPGGVAPSIGAVLAATAALISRDCSVSRDCGSAQISVATSSELAAVFAFALAFGAFSALVTSVFHDPSFRFVSFFVISKNNSAPFLTATAVVMTGTTTENVVAIECPPDAPTVTAAYSFSSNLILKGPFCAFFRSSSVKRSTAQKGCKVSSPLNSHARTGDATASLTCSLLSSGILYSGCT